MAAKNRQQRVERPQMVRLRVGEVVHDREKKEHAAVADRLEGLFPPAHKKPEKPKQRQAVAKGMFAGSIGSSAR